jgi:hypothetical protein
MGIGLSCAICGRHQVVGMLSAASWRRSDAAETVRACPDCVESRSDWRERLEAAAAASEAPGDEPGLSLA